MTHALAEPVCACPCACCRRLHQPDTERALAAAAMVGEGVDPYPFLIPERDLPIDETGTRNCGLCGWTVRGPLLPIITGEVIRMVGPGCARKHTDDRRRRPDNLLPLPLEGDDRAFPDDVQGPS